MSLPQFAQLIACGEADTLRNLFENPAERKPSFMRSLRAGNDQALVEACRSEDHSDIVYELIAHGADHKAQNHEPLRAAVTGGNIEGIEALFEAYRHEDDPGQANADPIPIDILNMAIALSLPHNGTTVAMEMLALGAEGNSMSLQRAIQRRDISLVEALLKAGVDPDGRADRHHLSHAARENLLLIGETLLKHGADPLKFYKSASKVARRLKHEKFLDLLRRYSPLEVSDELKAAAEEMAKPESGPGVWF